MVEQAVHQGVEVGVVELTGQEAIQSVAVKHGERRAVVAQKEVVAVEGLDDVDLVFLPSPLDLVVRGRVQVTHVGRASMGQVLQQEVGIASVYKHEAAMATGHLGCAPP